MGPLLEEAKRRPTESGPNNAMSEQAILIAGGYGVVGQRIAAASAPDYPVIVAGRHLGQAKAASAAIGHGVRSRLIDATVEASIAAALEGVSTVVSCIEQPQRRSCARLVQPGTVLTTLRPTNRGRTFPGK